MQVELVSPAECQNSDDGVGNLCGSHCVCLDKATPTGVHLDDDTCDCDTGFELTSLKKDGQFTTQVRTTLARVLRVAKRVPAQGPNMARLLFQCRIPLGDKARGPLTKRGGLRAT